MSDSEGELHLLKLQSICAMNKECTQGGFFVPEFFQQGPRVKKKRSKWQGANATSAFVILLNLDIQTSTQEFGVIPQIRMVGT